MITTEKLLHAIQFASQAHEGQKRKYTGQPYILHPLSVMGTVASVGGSEDMLIGALLHDVVEDTPITRLDVEAEFGVNVARIVWCLTDVYTPEDYPNFNRKQRKKMEADRLGRQASDIQPIKLADLIDNTSSIVEHDPGFARKYLLEKQDLLNNLTLGNKDLWGIAHSIMVKSWYKLNPS